MKGSILVAVLSTMALSLGTSSASSSSQLEKRAKVSPFEFTYDEPGSNLRVLQCDNVAFTRQQVYTAINQAITTNVPPQRRRWCTGRICKTYPSAFDHPKIRFRVKLRYKIFPIMADGTVYKSGNPGSYYVIYNDNFFVAGVVKITNWNTVKCLYNDEKLEITSSLWNRFSMARIMKNPFARNRQQRTGKTNQVSDLQVSDQQERPVSSKNGKEKVDPEASTDQ